MSKSFKSQFLKLAYGLGFKRVARIDTEGYFAFYRVYVAPEKFDAPQFASILDSIAEATGFQKISQPHGQKIDF